MSHGNLHVRGSTSYSEPASQGIRRIALLNDVSFVLCLGALSLKYFKITPLPTLRTLISFLSIGTIYFISQKLLYGITLGERCWRLHPKRESESRLQSVLYQCDFLGSDKIFVSSLITTLSVLFSLTALHTAFLRHPVWLTNAHWNLDPYLAPSSEWVMTPFFYTLGSWPKEFNGKPILFELLYDKGPPQHFVAKVSAELGSSENKITIEGPRTPAGLGNQSRIKECFDTRFSYSCILAREATLARHIEESRTVFSDIWPENWTINWFQINNPMVLDEEKIQGVYLRAMTEDQIQDRFIIISSSGIQQSIILDRRNNAQGNLAFDLVLKIVRSMRSLSELSTGRNWINQALQNIQIENQQNSLSNLSSTSGPTSSTVTTPATSPAPEEPSDRLAHLASIQTLLISRISVLPQSFDSYFHLGGISRIMLRESLKTSNPGEYQGIALRNLHNSYRYASDVSPNDPRLAQLEKLLDNAERNTPDR